MKEPHGAITVLLSDERTLSTPLNTVAKLPLPISSSILKDPTVVSPIFTRLDEEDWGGLAAMLDGLSADRSSFLLLPTRQRNNDYRSPRHVHSCLYVTLEGFETGRGWRDRKTE
jgi:hypothetical protein